MTEILYADVACQLSAQEVGGWEPKHMRKRKISVAVTWKNGQPSHRVYLEQDVEALAKEMQRARVVVGYNCRKFDFQLIRGYRPFKPRRSLDMYADLCKLTDQRVPITAIWQGTFMSEIDPDGLDYMELWRMGNLPFLVEVRIKHLQRMRQIHEFGVEHGWIAFIDRFRKRRRVKVDWKV